MSRKFIPPAATPLSIINIVAPCIRTVLERSRIQVTFTAAGFKISAN
jgi:hypothetical protein